MSFEQRNKALLFTEDEKEKAINLLIILHDRPFAKKPHDSRTCSHSGDSATLS